MNVIRCQGHWAQQGRQEDVACIAKQHQSRFHPARLQWDVHLQAAYSCATHHASHQIWGGLLSSCSLQMLLPPYPGSWKFCTHGVESSQKLLSLATWCYHFAVNLNIMVIIPWDLVPILVVRCYVLGPKLSLIGHPEEFTVSPYNAFKLF